VQKRFAITRELLEERGHTVLEFQGQGRGLLARLLTLSYLGDWASFYLAILSGVDPTPVALIEAMKRKLA
jgi:glucose/mannose-6-phosphate isomerase